MNNPTANLVLKEHCVNMILQKRKYILGIISFMIMFLISCSSDNNDTIVNTGLSPKEVISEQGVSVSVYDFQGFKPMLDYYNDTLYIFNFWATWCQPCVKELPYFNMADSAYAGKPVRIVLVSLDFTENVRSKLIPFIIENEINAEVIVLDDMDSNHWIPLVDAEWEGVIPATLFQKRNARKFEVGSYTYEELSGEIENFLNR